MARPRKATALLLVDGGFRADRHADRLAEPEDPVGPAPSYLNASERRCWREVAASAYWLRQPDRPVMELFCRLMAESRSNFVAFAPGRLRALVSLAGLLGIGPAARARLSVPPRRTADPADEFFQ